MRFFSARYSPAVTKGLRSKEGAKHFHNRSIFSSWLGHARKFLLQTTFFSNVCKSLDIPHILASRITFRSSFLNLVLRPPRVRCNCKESGLAPSRASFCGIHFVPTRTSAFSRYFVSSTQQFLGLDAVMTAGVIKTDDGKKFQSVVI